MAFTQPVYRVEPRAWQIIHDPISGAEAEAEAEAETETGAEAEAQAEAEAVAGAVADAFVHQKSTCQPAFLRGSAPFNQTSQSNHRPGRPMPLLVTTSDNVLEHHDEPRSAGMLYYVLRYDNLLLCETQLAAPLSQVGSACEIGRLLVDEPPQRKALAEERWSFSVADPLLSRTHARVYSTAEGCFVQDLGSKHGTFVNGELVVEPRLLADSDVLETGRSMFVFRKVGVTEGARAISRQNGISFGPTRTFCLSLIVSERELRRVAETNKSVLILGETGTGKEFAAAYIHQHSKRTGPLVALDCGAIPPNLVESDFFGHKRGAFTGSTEPRLGRIRAAQGGTLLLDEIGNLSEAAQAVLLRVMQENKVTPVGADQAEPVDVRYLAATNAELFGPNSRFRSDLLTRLSGYVLRLPPLRERREDLGVLASYFLKEAGVEKAAIRIRAARLLFAGRLTGNIRSLRMALTTGSALADGEPIDVEHLTALREELAALARAKARELEGRSVAPRPEVRETNAPKKERRKRPDREVLVNALAQAGGNQAAAGRILQVAERQIMRWMDAYQIPRAGKKKRTE